MYENENDTGDIAKPEETYPKNEPIEPEKTRLTKIVLLRWLIFLVFLMYVLFAHYRVAFLIGLGRYLMVDHSPQQSDLIVCLGGSNIERGLETADIYHLGFAPRIFIAREAPGDGYIQLKQQGIYYPVKSDLLTMLLEQLGVPASAILSYDTFVDSTWEEAEIVRKVAEPAGYGSLIIITSPIHSRRAWFIYQKVFEGLDVQIRMRYSRYSAFRPEDWWKHEKYLQDVIIEYQKLIFYRIKYLL
jgi:uncharacterized SAM-binding protein YcdF (DUF218 family)